jgi:protein SCO1
MKWFVLTLALCQLNFAVPPCCSTNLDHTGKVTDKSLYQIETVWQSDFGKPMKLEKLRGKTQVIAMFFSSCEFACPALVHDIRKIEKALPAELKGQVGFVLVTFDTERDTVEVLHAYRERMKLDSENWVLLRGEPEDILELSALLGVKFKKDKRGQFAHSNIITVLNPDGEVVRQQIGLNQEPDATIEAIKSSSKRK